ncbi:hypothetical protein GQ457_05G032860 [Hibiscus cannabinus]
MESNKFALLFVAMAAMLLAAAAPTATAARNEVMPFSILTNANFRNPLANIFSTDNPAQNCRTFGGCEKNSDCCSGVCVSVLAYSKICQ